MSKMKRKEVVFAPSMHTKKLTELLEKL